MSRIRIVGGKIIKTTGGDYNMYSKENIVFNAQGSISETAKDGISYNDPSPAPEFKMVDIQVTKVEGPFDDEKNIVKDVVAGESYMYKATPSRQPTDFELSLLKWAVKNDDKEEVKIAGISHLNQVASDGTMPLNIRLADCNKATVFAYFNDKSENEGVQVSLQGGDGIKENQGDTNIVIVNDEGTKLNQIKHEFVSVGESIAQIKRTTSASFTSSGTVIVTQFKSQVASRGEEVWAYKHEVATFEGTLKQAKEAFPDVDFSGLKKPVPKDRMVPEFNTRITIPRYSPLKWETLKEFDAADNGGKPTDWDAYLDATQTALDLAGLIPVVGEAADILSGTISLARGNYGDAAMSFASAIPVIGSAIGGIKIVKKTTKAAKKLADNIGVYDLVVKNVNKIEGYVGQSNDLAKRIEKHFNKSLKNPGKLSHAEKVVETLYKMPGATKFEKEMYEQFVIIRKHGGKLSKDGKIKYLINKVNPVGGRYKLDTDIGREKFLEEAIIIAKKYNLPTSFPKPTIITK